MHKSILMKTLVEEMLPNLQTEADTIMLSARVKNVMSWSDLVLAMGPNYEISALIEAVVLCNESIMTHGALTINNLVNYAKWELDYLNSEKSFDKLYKAEKKIERFCSPLICAFCMTNESGY